MKRILLIVSLMFFSSLNTKAQSIGPCTINAAGNSALIGSTVFDWSVGEMTLVSTFSTPGIVVTQGVLQPSDAMVSVPNTTPLSKQLKVFPNPATDLVNLQYTSANDGTLSVRLFDIAGKEISSQKMIVIPGLTTGQVDVKALAAATYMLEVTINSANAAPETVSYKIQKLK